jgi:arginine decarboxylase
MVEQGHGLLDAALTRAARVRAAIADMPGLRPMGREVVGPHHAADLDPLAISIDVRDLGISGMQAAEWLRTAYHVDVGAADQCRINARLTHADDDATEARLVDALRGLTADLDRIAPQPQVRLPDPETLSLETVMLPRDAFFAPTEQVPVEKAAGRVAAELVSPYPPGVPVLAPGELITEAVLDYLASGPPAGMLAPDAVDPSLRTLRVVAN